MIEQLTSPRENILGFRMSEKLHDEDYKTFVPTVEAAIDEHGISPDRISASTYGEFEPTDSNATVEGQASNRRAVIVILPEELPIQRAALAQAD